VPEKGLTSGQKALAATQTGLTAAQEALAAANAGLAETQMALAEMEMAMTEAQTGLTDHVWPVTEAELGQADRLGASLRARRAVVELTAVYSFSAGAERPALPGVGKKNLADRPCDPPARLCASTVVESVEQSVHLVCVTL
jgi:hypothetical protein